MLIVLVDDVMMCRSSKSSVTGDDFYGAYDAQDFAKLNSEELGVQTVPSLDLVFTEVSGCPFRSLAVSIDGRGSSIASSPPLPSDICISLS